MPEKKNTTTSLVISVERLEQVRAEAKEKETSISYIISLAIKKYFEDKEK